MYSYIKIFVYAFLMNTNHFVWPILSHLDDFAINAIANLFLLHGRLKIPKVHSDPSQICKMELSPNLVFS